VFGSLLEDRVIYADDNFSIIGQVEVNCCPILDDILEEVLLFSALAIEAASSFRSLPASDSSVIESAKCARISDN